jgi:hypothetical protein
MATIFWSVRLVRSCRRWFADSGLRTAGKKCAANHEPDAHHRNRSDGVAAKCHAEGE